MPSTDQQRMTLAAHLARRDEILRDWADRFDSAARCTLAPCRRARACRGSAPSLCLRAAMRATFGEDMPRVLRVLQLQHSGVGLAEAIATVFGDEPQAPDRA